ncbi:hypothetical protein [Corynebacterium sputi]|uniref:hypothetical protein n=1 Tax=Corynebacterium sputi TaxID=489915 RepID=UPI0004135026|nr:hypothetical protein [Corynebacterium sputi]
MNDQQRERRKPSRGEIAAARLLVKREREGKATRVVPKWVHEIAALGRSSDYRDLY